MKPIIYLNELITDLRINKNRGGNKMECNGLNRLRMMTILAFLFYLLMSSGLTFAQTADDYFQQGKTDLGQGSLENAYNNFKSALTLDPNHQGANLFYALTRILMISKSPAFNKLLDKADVSKEGRDIFDWTADFKRDPSGKILLPSDSPTGKELQDFLKNNILPEINGALDNLAKVGSSYNTIIKLLTENGSGLVNSPNTFTLPDTKGHWGPNELVGCKLKIGGTEYTITGNNPGNNQNTITVSPNWAILPGTYNYEIYEEIEIDYGDVLISKGSLYLAKVGIILLTSYNLAIDIDKIASLYQAATLNIQTDLINTYKDFLKLLPVQQVSQAKDLFAEAIDDFTSAINFIVAETDDQENDLFKVDPLEKDRFLNLLADLKNALSGTTFVREIGYDVNLTEFFDNPKTLRDFLPTFLGPYFIKKDSFPDPTFGGILPNMTSTELQKNLKEVIRESYPISPLVLYDDFPGPNINRDKWTVGEFVREIDVGNHKLVSKLASPNPSAVSSFPYIDYNCLGFLNPKSVNSFQADVTLLEDTIVNSARTRARLNGHWYNDGTPGGGWTGDINAEISLRKEPDGLRGNWFVLRYTNPGGTTFEVIKDGNFTTPINIGTAYTLYIEYDSVNHRFIFRIGSEEITFGPTGLPPRVGNAYNPGKVLITGVEINDATSSAYISATFDNVYKNSILYDDFSSPTIDPTRWVYGYYEYVREISGGKLRSKVRSSSPSNSPIQNYLPFKNPSSINAIQAKVTPITYHNNEGKTVVAWISGFFYNDGTPGGGHIGDAGGDVRIGEKGVSPVADWKVWRFTDFKGEVPEIIASGTFTKPILLNNTYTLFLGWDGNRFTFKIDGEEANYMPSGTVNPPNIPWKGTGTHIWDPAGKEATIEALFDDVQVNGATPPPPNQYTLTVSKSGTGSGTVTSSPAGIDCGSNCTEDVKTDTKITLKAKADTNSTFTGWSGGGCSGTGTCVVVMNADIAVTAAFSAKTPDISVSPSSLDFGSVNVGKKVTKTLKIMNNGTGDLVITLSGLEETDFSIQGSSGVTIKGKKSYTLKVLFTPKLSGPKAATLKIDSNDPDTPILDIELHGSTIEQPQQFTLTVTKAGTGSGTVTSFPVGINCGSDCSESYDQGTSVTLTATPASGSTFGGWSGDADCSDGVVVMNANKACTATFNPQVVGYTLTVVKSGGRTKGTGGRTKGT